MGEQAINSLSLFLQRILYPYKTPTGQTPKHIYFVTDLRKSLPLEDGKDEVLYTDAGIVKVTPTYNYYKIYSEDFPENVELEWQLPNAYAFYSFLKRNSYNPLYNYYSKIIKIDSDLTNFADFTLENIYDLSNESTTHLGETDDEGFSKYLNLLRHKTILFGKDVNELNENLKSVKHLFPYYNEVETPAILSPLADQLADENLIDSFVSLIGNYFSGQNGGLEDNTLHTFSIHNQSTVDDEATKSLYPLYKFLICLLISLTILSFCLISRTLNLPLLKLTQLNLQTFIKLA